MAADGGADTEAAGRWMTYAELARVRGIALFSVGKLVVRRKWRKQRDNHGVVRVLVPRNSCDPTRGGDRFVIHPASPPATETARSRAISALEVTLAEVEQRAIAAVEGLREQVRALRGQLAAAEQRLARAEQSRDIVIASNSKIAGGIAALRQADEARRVSTAADVAMVRSPTSGGHESRAESARGTPAI